MKFLKYFTISLLRKVLAVLTLLSAVLAATWPLFADYIHSTYDKYVTGNFGIEGEIALEKRHFWYAMRDMNNFIYLAIFFAVCYVSLAYGPKIIKWYKTKKHLKGDTP